MKAKCTGVFFMALKDRQIVMESNWGSVGKVAVYFHIK